MWELKAERSRIYAKSKCINNAYIVRVITEYGIREEKKNVFASFEHNIPCQLNMHADAEAK